jgi:hypothetical protein
MPHFDTLACRAGHAWLALVGSAGRPPTGGDHFTWGVDWEYQDLVAKAPWLSCRSSHGWKKPATLHWILVLHSLGWRPQPASLGDSLRYRADRMIWSRHPGPIQRMTTSFYREERAKQTEGLPTELIGPLMQLEPTTYFMSMLSDDVFRCSVHAIDRLLEHSAPDRAIGSDQGHAGTASAPLADDSRVSPRASDGRSTRLEYLGLGYDPKRIEVYRGDRRIRWEGRGLTTDVFVYLIRKGNELTTAPELRREFWRDKEDLSDETIEKRVRMVRPLIEPLGMTVKTIREEGWRLEELPDPGSKSAADAAESGPAGVT